MKYKPMSKKLKYLRIAAVSTALATFLAVSSCASPPPEDDVDGEQTSREEMTYTPYEDYAIKEEILNEYKRYQEKSPLAFSTTSPAAAESFEYSINGDSITLTKYIGQDEIVKIPEKINGAQVVSISDEAFSKSSVRAVYIPDTVKNIGFAAFRDCDSLATLRLSVIGSKETPTHLGYIFGAEKYEDNPIYIPRSLEMLIIGDRVEAIAPYSLFGAKNIKAVILPDTLVSVGEFAFFECESLLYLKMENADSLGEYSFAYCKSMIDFKTPENVGQIGRGTLMGCASLKSLTLAYLGKTAASEGYLGYIFGSERREWNESYIPTSLTDVTLLSNCKKIDAMAFADCHSIININLSEGLLSIGARAFSYCYSIKSISLPDTLKTIDDDAFFSCFSLEKLNIGKSSALSSIGKQAFFNCSSLTSVSLPKNVKEIKQSTFYGCSSLKELETAAEVEIHKDALSGCPLQK